MRGRTQRTLALLWSALLLLAAGAGEPSLAQDAEGTPAETDVEKLEFTHCPRCGAGNVVSATECTACGLGLASLEDEALRHCPRCETPILKGADQCPVCLLPLGSRELRDIYYEGELTFIPELHVKVGGAYTRVDRSRPGFKSTYAHAQQHAGADLWAYLHTSLPIGVVARYAVTFGLGGKESGRFAQAAFQRNRLDITTHLGDIGGSVPFRAFGIELAPFGAFTFERQVLKRSHVEQNTIPTPVFDLFGRFQRALRETRRMTGPTFGLRATWRPEGAPVEVGAWAAHTVFPAVKIRDEIFGTFRTRALLWRAGLSGLWTITEGFAIGLGLDYLVEDVRTTSLAVAVGGASQAFAQAPGVKHQELSLDFRLQIRF